MSSPLRIRIASLLSDAITDEVISVRYGAGGEAQIVINCFPLADAIIREIPPWGRPTLDNLSYDDDGAP